MTSNNKRKGNATVNKTIKALENEGYLVGKVERSTRFSKHKDLFNLFDLIAIKDGTTFYIQVKSNRPAPIKPLRDFANKYGIYAACFTWYDRRGFVIHWYPPGGNVFKVDLRKGSNRKTTQVR